MKLTNKFDYEARTRFIELNEPSPEWKYRVAFIFRYGYEKTKNENIIATAADVVFDSGVKCHLDLIGNDNFKLISFGLKHYPLNFQYFVRRLMCVFFPQRGFSGVLLFSKSAWLETEDEGSAKRIFKAQDTLLRLSIQKKYRINHVWTNSYHLRPRENPKDQYLRGVAYHQLGQKSLWGIFLSSFIYLRPMMLLGYLHARKYKLKSGLGIEKS
jgi:hypothetical protein